MAINRDKVLETAQKYVEKRKYDKAVAELRKLVEADPNDARTLLKIGDLQAKQGLYADAIGTYESVGKLYSHQGFALKAIAVYKQIREIIAKHVPQLEERYGHIAPKLADLYQQLGLTSDALAALDEVATRLQRQQKDQEAIDVFRKIVELDPTNPLPHLRLAEALSRVKDVEGAVFEFKTAASQLASIGRRDDALKVLERLLHHKHDPEQARICAELYLARSHPQDGMQALAKLQICFQANPRDFDTLSLLARAFNAIGQAAKAIEVQKEMARVARDTGKADLFREILERLIRVAPHDEGVRRLAQQNGALQAGAFPNDEAPPPREEAPRQQQQAYPAPPPYRAQPDAQARPRPDAFPAASPPPIDDDVEELSYEGDVEEIVDDAEIIEETDDAYAEVSYAESEAYVDATGGEQGGYSQGGLHQGGYEEAAASEVDANEAIAKALADANAFRRVHLYARALETLRAGLEIDPRSMDLYEVYRDVLIESDRIEDAVQVMLVIASLYVDALDGDSAARALQDVLAFDPSNARAIAMLQELGYEIVDDSDEVGGARQVEAGDYDELPAHDPRLPSYDLEEMAPADVSSRYADDRQINVGRGAPQAQRNDASAMGGEALPSFPLDEPAAYAEAAEHVPEVGRSLHRPDALSGEPPSIEPGTGLELEEALDEAEFFCSRGLFDDARAILNEQLDRHPNHPLLRERLVEIDVQEAQRGSGTRQKSSVGEGRAFDLDSSFDALEVLDYASMQPAEGHATGDEQIDVEEVFAKFKEGVAKQISVEDSDSHYNLGIAYKEMLLLDDAIREFDVAARDPKHECVCRSMIGMIQLERGNINEAIDAFLQGLNASIKDPSQETAICFEIGAAYEAKKMNKDALAYYQKAMRRDPNYRDVQERVRRLSKAEPKQNMRQVAVGADDEFDRAFDDLLSKA